MNPTTDLQLQLECYLNLKQALGFKIRAAARLLKDFVKFVEEREYCGPVTSQIVMEWVRLTSLTCGAAGQAGRLSIVRPFLSFLRATIPDTEIPERGLLAKVLRPTPYIFSLTEMQRLLHAASALGPRNSLRPHTFKTLIGLLASTGLRSSEAIHLKVADVELDPDPPRLLIKQTKFNKSRVVPLHTSTAEMLGYYYQQRAHLGYDALSDAFFVSEQGRMLSYQAARRTFETLTSRIGLHRTAERRAPTLHCLRHTFAVRRMLAWYQEGRDVKAYLPTLSIYLGHVRPEHSYWYLTATPELLNAAAVSLLEYTEKGGQV